MNRAVVVIAGLLLGIVASGSVGAARPEEPFVRDIAVDVIDLTEGCKQLPVLGHIRRLVCWGDRLLVAFDDEAGPALVECGAADLDVTAVWRLEGPETRAWRWVDVVTLHDGRLIGMLIRADARQDEAVECLLIAWSDGVRGQARQSIVRLPSKPAAMAPVPGLASLLCLDHWGNRLFAVDIDKAVLSWSKVIFDFAPHDYPVGRVLRACNDGGVYGSSKGRLFRYDPPSGFCEYLGPLPGSPGRLGQRYLSAWADGGGGRLAGGIGGEGRLITLDVEGRKVQPMGLPCDAHEIGPMVWDRAGCCWGIARGLGGVCRLFRFEVRTGRVDDLGIPAGVLRSGGRSWVWQAMEIVDMVALKDGRIVLAEGTSQAKLLVFQPERKEE